MSIKIVFICISFCVVIYLFRATSVDFAEDSSLMCSGFGDSNIRVWTLTPSKLRAVKQLEELELIDKEAGMVFLAHRIKISEILPWDRKFYFTQAILPRLSRCQVRATYNGCIGTHAHGRQVTSLLCLSDVIMCNCILAYSGTSRSLF